MRSGLRASRIQQRPGTSAGGSIATTSNNSPRRSTKRGFVSGVSSRMSSSKRQSSMPTGRSWRPAASARRGSASATRAYGGTSHCSFRWRTRTNRCSSRIEAATDRRRKVLPVDSIRPSTWLAELGFEGSPLGGTQRSARPSISTDGTTSTCGSSSATTAARTSSKSQKRSMRTPGQHWTRPPKYEPRTSPRAKPPRVKEEIVRERGYLNLRLEKEEVAEFEYSPTRCDKSYRMVVLRKSITVKRGQMEMFPEVRYLFYITNRRDLTASEIVLFANDRCEQEKVICQLKTPVSALTTPVASLVSNEAYMVMASLAWTMKAWFALLLPRARSMETPARRRERPRAAHGVQDVLERVHPCTSADRSRRKEDLVSAPVVEPMDRCTATLRRGASRAAAMLKRSHDAGVRMSRFARSTNARVASMGEDRMVTTTRRDSAREGAVCARSNKDRRPNPHPPTRLFQV